MTTANLCPGCGGHAEPPQHEHLVRLLSVWVREHGPETGETTVEALHDALPATLAARLLQVQDLCGRCRGAYCDELEALLFQASALLDGGASEAEAELVLKARISRSDETHD